MRRVKITTIILAIILVTLVAFAGVYIKTQNRMENKVKDYTLGRELTGGRVVQLHVVTEESDHDHDGDGKPDHEGEEKEEAKQENLTVENYEIVKKTIENRLNSFGQQDYTISLNEENGTIIVELPEDVNTDTYVYLLTAPAEVQIKEKDADTELLSDSMVEKSLYTYTANAEGAYQVYLELHLTEEGQNKIEEIKNNYAILESEVSEIEAAKEAAEKESEGTEIKEGESATEEVTTEETSKEEAKKIAILTIAGTEYEIDKIEKNKMVVKIGGQTTKNTSINNNMAAAAEIATLINAGKYPVEYEIAENRYVHSDITEKQLIFYAARMGVVLMVCVFLGFTIPYKGRGFLASVSFVGFISILSLILRYTNVNISIEGIGAILLTVIINLRVNEIMLRDGKEINYKELALNLAPVLIIALVFCFAKWANLSSFGMVMFWGLALIAVYNVIVTKTLLKLKENK